jgi:hypothetical protein
MGIEVRHGARLFVTVCALCVKLWREGSVGLRSKGEGDCGRTAGAACHTPCHRQP